MISVSPIFLDHAAGEMILPELARRYAELSAQYRFNPHGLTCYSELSRRALIDAERKLLQAAGIAESDAAVIWCASGTEALNLAMRGYCWKTPSGVIAADITAHPALRNTAADISHPVEYFLPSRNSRAPRAELTALSLVNNETGVIWHADRSTLSDGTILLADGCQAFGKIALPWNEAQIDMIVLSGRKIGGPASSAALIIRRKSISALRPAITGGGQQHGWRSGTVDVVSAILFAEAAALAVATREENLRKVAALNQRVRDGLIGRFGAQCVFFSPADASPYILAFAISGYEGALVTRILAERYGIIVGAGSACSAETHEVSATLRANGASDDTARGMIRVSFGHDNTSDDVDHLLDALPKLIKEF